MKKLFMFFILLSCVCWNCSSNSDDIENSGNSGKPDNSDNVTLDISLTDLAFEAQGGKKAFIIRSNSAWTIANNSSWCKTDVSKGSSDMVISITVESYDGTEDRNTNLNIKAGNITKILTVTQKYADAIILTKDKFNVPQRGGAIAIEVKSNIEYQVYIPSEFQSWIEKNVESKALATKNFNFSISANEEIDKREGYIIFSGNALNDTVYVYQAQKDQLILTQTTYNIPAEGQDITVELSTNVDYDILIPNQAVSWIDQLTTKALRTDQLKFRIATNTESNERSAKITIKDRNGNLSDTLYINQFGKNVSFGNVIFETVEDVEIFKKSGRTEINGNLIIQGNKLKTLVYLDNILEKINGSLKIECSSLTTLDGLYHLTEIRDSLIIKDYLPKTFEGLNNLTIIGRDFKILSLPNLVSFEGLNSLTTVKGSFILSAFGGLNALESFKGLDKLSTIGENFEINSKVSMINLSSLYSLKSFDGLESLTYIGQDFKIDSRSQGRSDTEVNSSSLGNLTSFQGLNNLQMIGGSFVISSFVDWYSEISDEVSCKNLSALESFEGLGNLVSIGQHFKVSCRIVLPSRDHIYSLNKLKSFKGLEKLSNLRGNLEIDHDVYYAKDYTHPLKLSSFVGLEGLVYIPGDFLCSDYVSTEGLENLKTIDGNFNVKLAGNLSSLEKIGGNADIEVTSSSINYLCNLKSVRNLNILNSKNLTNIDGFLNLKTVGDITIRKCPKLYDYCILKPKIEKSGGNFYTEDNGYNPTKYQLLNGQCSLTLPDNN